MQAGVPSKALRDRKVSFRVLTARVAATRSRKHCLASYRHRNRLRISWTKEPPWPNSLPCFAIWAVSTIFSKSIVWISMMNSLGQTSSTLNLVKSRVTEQRYSRSHHYSRRGALYTSRATMQTSCILKTVSTCYRDSGVSKATRHSTRFAIKVTTRPASRRLSQRELRLKSSSSRRHRYQRRQHAQQFPRQGQLAKHLTAQTCVAMG